MDSLMVSSYPDFMSGSSGVTDGPQTPLCGETTEIWGLWL